MAATGDVSIELGKILVDDSISSGTCDLSGVDRLPLGDSTEHVQEAGGLCMDNSHPILYSNSESMCTDDTSSPDPGKKYNYGNTAYNSPFIARMSRPVKRNLNSEIELKKTELNHTLEEDDVQSSGLESGLSTHTPQRSCNSPDSDIMLIDSPPAESLQCGEYTHCDSVVQGISSEYKESEEKKVPNPSGEYISPQKNPHDNDNDDSDMSRSPITSYGHKKMSRKVGAKVEKPVQICKVVDVIRRVPKEFNGIKKRLPATPTRNARNPGLRDFLGSPSHIRNMRLLGSPVGRKIDFDCAPRSSTPKPKHGLEKMNNSAPEPADSQSTPIDLFLPRKCNSEAITRIDRSRLHLWVNPFSPAGRSIISDIRNVQERIRRRRCDGSFIDERESQDSPKKRKRPTNSRYELEFIELEEIGTGEHGCVYKCLNLINGLIYAVKISKHKVKRGYAMETAQNELYAHGVLEHKNIVRNYSSWVEDGYVYIQNEFCNKGNLESYMGNNPVAGSKAKKLMYDIACALRYMHNFRLVHLDVKPGNIFVHEAAVEINDVSDSESEEETEVAHVTFKLGDFGHIIHLDNLRNLEEGDCRYMARELLNEDKTDLTKADIFSLALSVYEAAGGGGGAELPKNGDGWHVLRDGGLRKLPTLSDDMNLLLQKMTAPDLTKRPSAAEICKMLAPGRKTEKLKEELQSKTQKIAVLEAKQRERNSYIKELKAQSLKFIQASDDIHTPRCTEKLPGKQNKRYSRIHFV